MEKKMAQQPSKTALVVEGGAMRGIFSAGLFDGFLERGFNPFHLYIGVSAGASNIAAYLAEMPGRNRRIYTELTGRPEFINISRFLRGGHLMDLDWMWEVTISRMRLDLATIYAKSRPFVVGLTDVRSGKAVYKETSAGELEHLLKATSALPVLYRDFPLVDGRPVADGGVADPIPVAEAIRRGARRIMVIRSRPGKFRRRRDLSSYFITLFLSRYPELRTMVQNQNRIYNEAVSLVHEPPSGVSVVEICPPVDFRLGRFSTAPEALQAGYAQGSAMADEAIARWHRTETGDSGQRRRS
jgi:predicted patatin/cPLA2 family phospholipase